MEEEYFKYLSSEIIIAILSWLPLGSVAVSKCVCKSWLDLIETDYFVNSRLAKSISALAVLTPDRESNSNWCKVFELGDEIDLRYKILTKFEFPRKVTIVGSANGLLLLQKHGRRPDVLYICNPITREYAEICCSEKVIQSYYRFGVSKVSGQYKVVAVDSQSECRVYTLGTESWRKVEAPASINQVEFNLAVFVNGGLFWTVKKPNNKKLIACFDLETECFSSFRPPPASGMVGLCVLEECLCFCEWEEDEIVIWLMLENGFKKRWRKEYVMRPGTFINGFSYDLVYPIKVFKNGDVLMLWDREQFFCYFSETKTIEEIVGVFDVPRGFIYPMLLTPSSLSLRGLGKEDVISF